MKKIIYFPPSYKKALLKKTKTVTIRVGNEVGKYKENHIYDVFSYSHADWKLRIKINKVDKIKASKLSKFCIPERSIKSLIKKTGLHFGDRVELIHFSYPGLTQKLSF